MGRLDGGALGDPSKQLMVFPFTVPLDGAGKMRDPAQGVYARSLARTLAERLSVAQAMSAVPATLTSTAPVAAAAKPPPPVDAEAERGTGWVVASQPWTLDEACKVGLPEGVEYLLHGVAELTDRVRLRLLLVDQPRAALALDHVVLRPRSELFSALDEAASAVATAMGADLPPVQWPTSDVEAYVAYLRGRDMSAAHETGVAVPDAAKSFDGYLEAVRRDPTFHEAQDRVLALALDFALGGQGPVDAARAGCQRLLKLDAGAFKAHAALAEIDLAQGHVREAIDHLRAAVELKSDWVPAWERLGTALLRAGEYTEARSWLERSVAERPEDADALQGLGVALAETGDVEGAVTRFQEAIDKGGHSVALHENLARALASLGRHREAREQRALARKLAGKAPFGLGWLRTLGQAVTRLFSPESADG